MTALPVKTYADIMDLEPCFDPAERGLCTHDWAGTALDVLADDRVSDPDALWVVCREGWIDDRTLRLFAVWCARQALALIDTPDKRSVAACEVAERYANGEATVDELSAARAAAGDAAWDAAWAAARAAAGDAAGAAARAAAGDAAGAAAWAAAWDAARAAAGDAAGAAARDAARAAQRQHLLQMVRELATETES